MFSRVYGVIERWKDAAVNWRGPFLKRYWATLDFEDLVYAIEGGDSEFANEYLKQLRACAGGRKRASEGRRNVDRNAPA